MRNLAHALGEEQFMKELARVVGEERWRQITEQLFPKKSDDNDN